MTVAQMDNTNLAGAGAARPNADAVMCGLPNEAALRHCDGEDGCETDAMAAGMAPPADRRPRYPASSLASLA